MWKVSFFCYTCEYRYLHSFSFIVGEGTDFKTLGKMYVSASSNLLDTDIWLLITFGSSTIGKKIGHYVTDFSINTISMIFIIISLQFPGSAAQMLLLDKVKINTRRKNVKLLIF